MILQERCAGKVLLEGWPGVGSMTGGQVLASLAKGSEMRKAWVLGSGGSNRLVHCLVSQGAGGRACIAYDHGWLRKAVQHPIDRSAQANHAVVVHYQLLQNILSSCMQTCF